MPRPRPPSRDSTPAPADLLLHPLRLRIVQTLLNSPPLSPKAMLERLPGVAPATLYRHLQVLTQAGLTVVAAERAVRGVVEKSYALGAAAQTPTPAEVLQAGPDEQFRFFANFVSTLMAQYGAYLAPGGYDLVRDGVAFRQAAIHATDAEYMDFVQSIARLVVEASARPPQPGRRRRLVNFILMPGPQTEPHAEPQPAPPGPADEAPGEGTGA